jgi:hypothetical protein
MWTVFAHPGAEQRIRRLLALPGQPGLNHAARQLGIKNATLTSQVRQLETTVGTALLRTGPDGRLTLTAYGQRFARDVRPALESLAQSLEGKGDNYGTLPRVTPEIVHLPGNQPAESCSTTTKRPAHDVQVHAIPTSGLGPPARPGTGAGAWPGEVYSCADLHWNHQVHLISSQGTRQNCRHEVAARYVQALGAWSAAFGSGR